jgi:anti-sigma B factor antagonist
MALLKDEAKGEIRLIVVDVVRLVDGPAIDQCYREIVEVLNRTEESNVVLHFGPVTFMSSSALGMLIRVNKKCKEFEIALKLCGISPDIQRVFKITNLDKVFDIHDDTAQAVEAFKKSGRLLFRKRAPTRHNIT